MGQQQSKNELLYQQVIEGDVESIKALHNDGASLEWIDKDGKTPLIVACMKPNGLNVAKTLLELGANVNAFRPGYHAGTALHHAAKRGLDDTVQLLLSYGANPLIKNDACQTPLEVARAKGFSDVVRTIERQICIFSGWMREFYGPGFLEALAPQLLSRKIWVVVIPCGIADPMRPLKLQLAIYSSLQDAQPRNVIVLWRAIVEEIRQQRSDPVLTIFDKTSSNTLLMKLFSVGALLNGESLLFLSTIINEQLIYVLQEKFLYKAKALMHKYKFCLFLVYWFGELMCLLFQMVVIYAVAVELFLVLDKLAPSKCC